MSIKIGPSLVFLTLNTVIVTFSGFVLYHTGNPLAMLGLMFLRDIPVVGDQNEEDEEEDEDANGFFGPESDEDPEAHTIGFNAKTKKK